MKNVLITGGAGFIGSHLCERFLEKGDQVVCVDNLLTGSKKNIQHLLEDNKFYFINQDIVNISPNNQLPINSFQLIYHLASPASPNKNSPYSYIQYPIETLLVNSVGTRNMLELAKKYKSRFIFASTSEVYGDPEVHPQREDYWGNVNPVGFRSCYDEGKRFGEAITMAYCRQFKIDIRIARIFNTYGPRMLPEDGRVVSNFIVQTLRGEPITVYGNGEQTRSFCFVSDMVDALIKLGEKENIAGQIFNLGNPNEIKIIELAELIKNTTGANSKIIFKDLPEDDPKKREPDIKKAKKILSWSPQVSLEEGLRLTTQYFRKICAHKN